MQQILKETEWNLEKIEVKSKKNAEKTEKSEKQQDSVMPEEWKNKYQIADKKIQEVLLCFLSQFTNIYQ